MFPFFSVGKTLPTLEKPQPFFSREIIVLAEIQYCKQYNAIVSTLNVF